jgi:hypothetical protein
MSVFYKNKYCIHNYIVLSRTQRTICNFNTHIPWLKIVFQLSIFGLLFRQNCSHSVSVWCLVLGIRCMCGRAIVHCLCRISNCCRISRSLLSLPCRSSTSDLKPGTSDLKPITFLVTEVQSVRKLINFASPFTLRCHRCPVVSWRPCVPLCPPPLCQSGLSTL